MKININTKLSHRRNHYRKALSSGKYMLPKFHNRPSESKIQKECGNTYRRYEWIKIGYGTMIWKFLVNLVFGKHEMPLISNLRNVPVC